MHLSEKAYDKLKRMILSGRFKGDGALSERSLAALLSVSRVPVREAIKELEREGLLIIVPRSGILIRRLSLDEVRELYEVRQAVEGMAAYLCATRKQGGAVKAMRERLEALAAKGDDINHAAIQRASAAFHRMLFDVGGNSQLRAVYETLEPRIDLNLRITAVHDTSRIEQALDEHIKIARAIERRDGDKAERLTRLHLENGKTARLKILAGLEQEGEQGKPPRSSMEAPRSHTTVAKTKVA
jgi:DNA-binding GntR family transcriptional regulator